ncbi:MAG: hypothetical protein V1873_04535 [Verrucomicrobiota bacterium]
MKRLLLWAAAAFLLAVPVRGAGTEPRTFDWGFIASRQVDVNGDLRLKLLGPFFESAVSTNGLLFWAFRPVYGSVRDPADQHAVKDILWPVAYDLQFRNEHGWRFLLAFYKNFDVTVPEPRYRFWILPIYFQGRDKHGQSYVGVFPLGGQVNEILGRDEATFFLFPLTMYSSINKVETRDVLWPIYSRTEGKGIYRFRVFPFYSRAIHRDLWEKRFILWPFWTWAHYHYPRSSGTGYIVFPLWGHFDLQDQKAWLVFPPLFRFSWGQRMNYSYCPWPFFQMSSGEIEKLYFWPLWGRKTMPGLKTTFFLWPIFRTEKVDRGDAVARRFMAVPFVQTEVLTKRPEAKGEKGEVVSRYFKLWPLFRYQREGSARHFRFLELWPLRHTAPVERCYAPLWTLYSHAAVGDSVGNEVLWGLYRSSRRGSEERSVSLFPLAEWSRDSRGEGRREWAVLKGLVGYRREGTQRTLRVLYWPVHFGPKEKAP